MNKTVILVGISAVVMAVLLVLYWPHTSTTKPTVENAPTEGRTSGSKADTTEYIVPQNLTAYIKKMDAYTSEGGQNPSLNWPYTRASVTVPVGSSTPAYAAEVAANQIQTGGGPARITVTHFKIVQETAYILLNIDEDGWAGVSFALNKVHPLVERTLLLDPSIKKVVFGLPPELKASAVLQ